MPFESAPAPAGWSARLALAFARHGDRTVLVQRAHAGPLHVQKALYPEGPRVCHAIVLHPPAGIAGGDSLEIDVDAQAGSHVLLTTPGATKWYRTNGAEATQRVRLRVAAGGIVEWLPQESIVFDGARAQMALDVTLAADAAFVGMEVICLGRTASGERFARGALAVASDVQRDGALLWRERGRVHGSDPLLDSPVGFAGQPVAGTLLVASMQLDPALRDACRERVPTAGRGAVTLTSGMLIARYLGPACEPGRAWLAGIWSCVRQAVTGSAPMAPRIWST
jgi:urease accessory protein